jgi:exosome complex component CSL4
MIISIKEYDPMSDNKKSEKELKVVTPGEVLGVIEEFSPGNNCYEIDGQIVSEAWGTVQTTSEHQIKINPLKKVFTPTKGSIALGLVSELRKQSATVTLTHFKMGRETNFRSINYSTNAMLHISNVSDRYIRAIHDGVRPGDYIICKVLSVNPDLRISLFGSRDLGVISAICYSCGYEVDRIVKRNLIRCNNCGATQNRVLSSFFGKTEQLLE